ncbi:MAG: P-loop NTPase [Candidatus Altimarinota bacterium]
MTLQNLVENVLNGQTVKLLMAKNIKKLRGIEKVNTVLENFPQTEEIFNSLGIKIAKGEEKKTLVEIAQANKVPLQILLNNLAKASGLEVEWPKISGLKEGYESDFSASTGLRKGRPGGVKKIVAVHSGKGGVGKTFCAISLALKAAEKGVKVGLLDLDIDCPNIPKQLGLTGRLTANAQKKIEPQVAEGVKVISMAGVLDKENQPILWRGPILARAIEQLLHDSNWGELDLLVIDLPPGTSDAPLTLFNLLKPDAVILVTTPQPSALMDTAKSLEMCRSLGVEVVGVIENMQGEIFGDAAAEQFFDAEKLKYLGGIELRKAYSQDSFAVLKEEKLGKLFGKILKIVRIG